MGTPYSIRSSRQAALQLLWGMLQNRQEPRVFAELSTCRCYVESRNLGSAILVQEVLHFTLKARQYDRDESYVRPESLLRGCEKHVHARSSGAGCQNCGLSQLVASTASPEAWISGESVELSCSFCALLRSLQEVQVAIQPLRRSSQRHICKSVVAYFEFLNATSWNHDSVLRGNPLCSRPGPPEPPIHTACCA